MRPDCGHEIPVHTMAVLVEDNLKRGQRHNDYNVRWAVWCEIT
jgi:hypothetical protein